MDVVGAGGKITTFGEIDGTGEDVGGTETPGAALEVITGAGTANGLRGLKGLSEFALCFKSDTSFFRFSRVVFKPGKRKSIACATRRSEN